VLVDPTVDEASALGTLPDPPFNVAIFYWDQTPGCCAGSYDIAITDERAMNGTKSLKSAQRLFAELGGASADVQIRIPAKYLPLSRATIRLSRYIESIGPGVLTLTLVDDNDIGLLWRSDGSVAFRNAIPGGGSTAQNIGNYGLPGAWVRWELEFDFAAEQIHVSVQNDPIGVFSLPTFALQHPWAFVLGSNVIHGRTGNNVFYDDDIFASVVPLCDPAEGDCNRNGISDRCDVDPDLGGISLDCNGNGIPDECETDRDFDGTIDVCDGCPDDGMKTEEGICRCGVSDVDSDGDDTPDCMDDCPNDGTKTEPGTCGCGVGDADSDGDGIANCVDDCPSDPDKTAPGLCGCGVSDSDSDGDGGIDCVDACPNDPNKVAPGICGCGDTDIDTDVDGTPNCIDGCPNDPDKTVVGICGCGNADIDTDGDGTLNCDDQCPNNPDKTEPGICGCSRSDNDSDRDGVANCQDDCEDTSVGTIVDQGGCPVDDPAGQPVPDEDGDGVPDDTDLCPDTASGATVDDSGCSTERVLDSMPNRCGACGAFGMISWTLLLVGFVGLRTLSGNGRKGC